MSQSPLDRLLDRLKGQVRAGQQIKALCPAHEDREPSLTITEGEGGRVLIHCQAGCSPMKVLQALDLDWSDLFSTEGSMPSSHPKTTRSRPGLTAAEVQLRHAVYEGLLQGLPLTPEHRSNLESRGLSLRAIEHYQYRSLSYFECMQTLGKLYQQYGQDLYQVPGFLSTTKGEPYLSVKEGLLIPVREPTGRIVACQVRTESQHARYKWLSGNVSSSTPPHTPRGMDCSGGTVRVTEGPLKADIAWSLDPSVPTLACPGVSHWGGLLPLLQAVGAQVVRVAFDADWEAKPAVADQLYQFLDRLDDLGFEVQIDQWPLESGKGLDDLLAGGYRPEVLSAGSVDRSRLSLAEVGDCLILVRGSDLHPKPIEWLWQDWLALGTLTLLDGDPGLGKSQLACALIAAVTAGVPLPGGCPTPQGHVLILSCEDDPHDTWRPRLDAAGANPDHITFLEGRLDTDGQFWCPEIPADLDAISRVVQANEVLLLLIDPLFSFVDAKYDAHKDQHMKLVLSAVTRMARKSRCCVLGVRHLNKQKDQSNLYRGTGSTGIIGTARSALLMVQPPDSDPGERWLLQIKNNLSKQQPGYSLRIEGVSDPIHGMKTSKVIWGQELDEQASRSLGTSPKETLKSAGLAQWLFTTLADGAKPTNHLLEEAERLGYSGSMLRKVKRELGFRSRKEGRVWVTDLPVDPRSFIQGEERGA